MDKDKRFGYSSIRKVEKGIVLIVLLCRNVAKRPKTSVTKSENDPPSRTDYYFEIIQTIDKISPRTFF